MVGCLGVECAADNAQTVRFVDQIGRGLAHGEMDLPDILLAMYLEAPSADALIENVVAHVKTMEAADQFTLSIFIGLLADRITAAVGTPPGNAYVQEAARG